MTTPVKASRTIEVPIVFDPTFEDAVHRAKHALDTTAKELLETFQRRVQVEATLTGEDPTECARRIFDQDQDQLATLQNALADARAALVEHSRVFTFRAIGWRRWRQMKSEHPSKSKDLAFDLDAIAPVLLREASDLSAGEVDEILTSAQWSEGEVLLLLNAAVTVQS